MRVMSEHPGEATVTKLSYNNETRMYRKQSSKPCEVVHNLVPIFVRLRQRSAMSSRPASVNRSRLCLVSKTNQPNKNKQQWQ